MFALTVHQPFAHFLATGAKPVENRDWRPPASLVGKWIAIHAGKQYDLPGALAIRSELAIDVPEPSELAHGAIVAVAVLDRIVTTDLEAGHNEWFSGPYGWWLREVVKIEPVPCRGYQKLWKLDVPTLEVVRARYRDATKPLGQAVSTFTLREAARAPAAQEEENIAPKS